MVCQGSVVLATDTRATAGHLFIAHKHVKKVLRVDQHLAMTVAGGVADAQNIVDTLRYYANTYKLDQRYPIPIKSAARLASNVFFANRLYPYYADVLVAGVDSTGPHLYNVDLFGSLSEEEFISTGSGSPVAYGILETEFKSGMKIDAAIPIAIRAIGAAIKRNAGTGDGIDVSVIDSNGYRELTDKEKEEALPLALRGN